MQWKLICKFGGTIQRCNKFWFVGGGGGREDAISAFRGKQQTRERDLREFSTKTSPWQKLSWKRDKDPILFLVNRLNVSKASRLSWGKFGWKITQSYFSKMLWGSTKETTVRDLLTVCARLAFEKSYVTLHAPKKARRVFAKLFSKKLAAGGTHPPHPSHPPR